MLEVTTGGKWEEGYSACKAKVANCMVVSDSLLRIVGAEHADILVECFPGIKTEQLPRVIERRNVGSPETVIICVGTDDLSRSQWPRDLRRRSAAARLLKS